METVRFQNADKDKPDLFEVQELKTEYIGDKAQIVGNSAMPLYGIGLVTGLDNTGEDPPPSNYRSTLVREMERRGVKNPQAILKDPSTALVLIEAYLNPDVRKGEAFDVMVRVPENSATTSLAGGWLMEAYLWEMAYVQNVGELTGRAYATAEGPVLLSMGQGEAGDLAAKMRQGKVLGGGKALLERNLGMVLRADAMGVRNSKQIADRIGERFHSFERSLKVPMAKAKDNKFIELKVHPTYKQNYPRYMQVIRNIAFRETPVEQRERLNKLKEQLQNPDLAAVAAIRMEAIGKEAVPFLKTGLNSQSTEVKFYAAESLAYLGDESGVEILGSLAKQERAFRAYAFAALSTLAEPSCFVQLRQLLSDNSPETRYGAFRALWTIDPNDPAIRGKRLNDQFNLHPLNTTGEPMIHLTRNRVAELVLFGRDQKLTPPMALKAGPKISVNAQSGSDKVIISRYEVGHDERREVSTNVFDIVLAVAELGATYPDVAAMLTEAKLQHCTTGRVEVDALPAAGRLYYRTEDEQKYAQSFGGTSGKEKSKVGRESLNPGLFPSITGDVKDDRADPFGEPEESPEKSTGGKSEPKEGKSASWSQRMRKWNFTKRKSSADALNHNVDTAQE